VTVFAEDHQILGGDPVVLLFAVVPGQRLEDGVTAAFDVVKFFGCPLGILHQILGGGYGVHANGLQDVLPQAHELKHGGGGSVAGGNAVDIAVDDGALDVIHGQDLQHVLAVLLKELVDGLALLLVDHGGQVGQAVPVQVNGLLVGQHDVLFVPVLVPGNEDHIDLHVQVILHALGKFVVQEFREPVGFVAGVENGDLLHALAAAGFGVAAACQNTQQHNESQCDCQCSFHNDPPFVVPGIPGGVYSFTAPVMMPLTKYFWTKGYRKIMGPMVIMVTAIFTVSAGSWMPEAPAGIRPELTALTLERMLYR
jgi:hypothetical protein